MIIISFENIKEKLKLPGNRNTYLCVWVEAFVAFG